MDTSRLSRPGTLADLPLLDGKVIVLTGATSGIGKHTAGILAGAGANLVLAVPDAERGEHIRWWIDDEYPGAGERIHIIPCRLDDLASVRTAAEKIGIAYGAVDALGLIAGVAAQPVARTGARIEWPIGAHYLGHFALTLHLLDRLQGRRDRSGRVVVVTSSLRRWGSTRHRPGDGLLSRIRRVHEAPPDHAHRGHLDNAALSAEFTVEAARRVARDGLDLAVVGVDPGLVHVDPPRLRGAEPAWRRRTAAAVLRAAVRPATEGAAAIAYALTAPEVDNGALYGPTGLRGSPGRIGRLAWGSRVRDPVAAARNWSQSESLTQVYWPDEEPGGGSVTGSVAASVGGSVAGSVEGEGRGAIRPVLDPDTGVLILPDDRDGLTEDELVRTRWPDCPVCGGPIEVQLIECHTADVTGSTRYAPADHWCAASTATCYVIVDGVIYR
jgi:NAD(P)-dependent dehydrogenase (short-subunit alcohol dehydrogenase family)